MIARLTYLTTRMSVYDLKCAKITSPMLAEYNQKLREQYSDARSRIEKILGARKMCDRKTCDRKMCDRTPAVVLDIDETCLVNLMYVFNDPRIFDIYDEEYNAREFARAFTFENRLNPIVPAFRPFYEFLVHEKVHIFYLTGRTGHWEEATKKNMALLAIDQYEDIFFNKNHEPTAIFKMHARKFIRDMGYDLIYAIGDQESDVYSSADEWSVQEGMVLYNPFYSLLDPSTH